MLSLEEFNYFEKGKVFVTGRYRLTRWIAIKNRDDSWTIYKGPSYWLDEKILAWGIREGNLEAVQELVPCSSDVFKKYKFR